jgi:hypothetical protein
MTYEQWVEATKKGISLGDDAANDAADNATPIIDPIAYNAFSGEGEEEEAQKPETFKNPDPPSHPGPRGLFKKPLGQAFLSK